MNFTIIDAPQRSPEWHQARCGRLTASRAADMLAVTKSGPSASRKNLRAQLVLERLTGKPQESGYVSPAMQAGIDREADARALYEALTGRILETTGFLSHMQHAAGCSLDGHVGNFEGLIEAKCPQPATHLDYLTTGIVSDGYLKQIVHALWITGASWCDWISYNPDFPDGAQVKLVRVPRIEADIAAYEKEALAFLREVDAEEQKVRTALHLTAQLSAAVA